MPLHVNMSSLEGTQFKDRQNPVCTCIGMGQNPDGTVFVIGTFVDPQYPTELKVLTELIKLATFHA